MLTLDRFKLYAHIDHADEDELIESLIRAADTAVRDMTGKEPPSDSDELFDGGAPADGALVRKPHACHGHERDTGAVYRADPAQSHRHVRSLPGKGGLKWR